MGKSRTLPRTLLELLEVALKDIEAAAGDNRYIINMSEWHSNWEDNGDDCVTCEVCLAGSVMAGTLGVRPYMDETPYRMHEKGIISRTTSNKLQLLDTLRSASWWSQRRNEPRGRVFSAPNGTLLGRDKDKFIRELKALISGLKRGWAITAPGFETYIRGDFDVHTRLTNSGYAI